MVHILPVPEQKALILKTETYLYMSHIVLFIYILYLFLYFVYYYW